MSAYKVARYPVHFTLMPIIYVQIQPKPNERILFPPGGLEIPTGLTSPFPEKVEIREVRMIPTEDRVEIAVDTASPIPDFTIRVSKK